MTSFTSRQLYEKAIAAPEYDRKTVMLFGLTLVEILERIEFYDSRIKSEEEYIYGFKAGFEAGKKYSERNSK